MTGLTEKLRLWVAGTKLRIWGLKDKDRDKDKREEVGKEVTKELTFVFSGETNTLALIRVKTDNVEVAVTPKELFDGMEMAEAVRNQILGQGELNETLSEVDPVPVIETVEQVTVEQVEKGEQVNMPDINSPFGTLSTDEGKKKAPTKAEVAANPGEWDGTSFDPLAIIIPNVVIPKFSSPHGVIGKDDDGHDVYAFTGGTFADWFKLDSQGALAYYQQLNEGHGLNLMALSEGQKGRLGLLPKDLTKK